MSQPVIIPHQRQRLDSHTELHWQLLSLPICQQMQVELWMCQLHCQVRAISGNKWLKLKYQVQQMQPQGKRQLLSFGGAFSNHLAALAAYGAWQQIPTIGLVRTERLDAQNPTLAFCRQQGMRLIAVPFAEYRQRHTADFLHALQQHYPEALIIPEGGSSPWAIPGVASLPLADTPQGSADVLCVATASGGTLAGLIQAYPDLPIDAIAVVKDDSLPAKVRQLGRAYQALTPKQPLTRPAVSQDEPIERWQIIPAADQTAYAKFRPQLLQFCLSMAAFGCQVEPVYTGKALHTLIERIRAGAYPAGTRLSFFHTGGEQGIDGLHYRQKVTDAQHATLRGLST
jgi:1-aminocyclopropane-1-carboxylate deaminase/D-cysteine desulfhydrase-like pyridoxal-dependent ACC family enzyme